MRSAILAPLLAGCAAVCAVGCAAAPSSGTPTGAPPAPANAPDAAVSAPAAAVSTLPAWSAQTADARHTLTIAAAPGSIPLNQYFDLEFQLQGPDASGCSLLVDADMPEHKHGMMTRPEVEDLGGGRFVAHGFLFHMPGLWEIHADVLDPGGVSRATWKVRVQP